MSDGKGREGRSVAELMQHEHEWIDRGLELLLSLQPCIRQSGHGVLSALRGHMALEESRIFPVFESAGYAAPVQLMLLEHEKIRRHIEEISALLATGDISGLENETRRLAIRLGEHNGKEEAIFYDRLGAILDEGSRRHLLHHLFGKNQQWEQ